MRGKGSGEGSLLVSFCGVENGFWIGRVCSTRKALLPLFLTGEKGLVDATDGSVFTACDLEINCLDCRLGGVDGCVWALLSFLYSLYLSAEGNGRGQRRSRHLSSGKDRTNIWPVLDILDGRIPTVFSFKVSFPSLDFCAKGSDVHGRRRRRRSEGRDRCRNENERQQLNTMVKASRRPPGPLSPYRPFFT